MKKPTSNRPLHSPARSPHSSHLSHSSHPPRPPRPTPDGSDNRSLFGRASAEWNNLTDPERHDWNQAAIRARRYHRHLRRLSGQQLFVKVYSTRVAFGLHPLRLPPPLTAAHTNPVDALIITQRRGRLSLKLELTAAPTCPILLYAAAPCNPGVSVAFKFARLGLLPAPVNGLSDITQLYAAQYGLPRPGQRVFIRTRCLENYLSDFTRTTNALAPLPPGQVYSPRPPADLPR